MRRILGGGQLASVGWGRRMSFDHPYARATAASVAASARLISYSAFAIGTALGLPRSLILTRKVSLAVMAATAAMIVMPKAMAPTVTGMLAEPGGATVANSAGRRAVVVVPTFWEIAIAETRVRVGNSSG